MGKRNSKIGIIILIIMLSVGFAAVTTNLIINGTSSISANPDDFNVFFSYARASNGSTAVIEESKQEITFSGKTLMAKGDKAVLNYTVKNDSSQYDANITLTVRVFDSSGKSHKQYYQVTKEGFTEDEPTLLSSKSAKDGSITIELVKPYLDEEFTLTIQAVLNVEAVERDTTGSYDTISGTAYDINGNVLANTPLVMFSEPTYFVTDDEGHYELTLPKGIHNAYYMPGKTMEELQAMGLDIKTNLEATSSLVDTSVNTDLIFGFRQIGDLVTLGGERFHYLGITNDGYYKLLAEYPISVISMKQSKDKYSVYNFSINEDEDGLWCKDIQFYMERDLSLWVYDGYDTSLIKPYVDQYVSSLYDPNFDFDRGRLLTMDELVELTNIDVPNDYHFAYGEGYLGPTDIVFLDDIDNSRKWLTNSYYWLYDTITLVSNVYFYQDSGEINDDTWADIELSRNFSVDSYYDYDNDVSRIILVSEDITNYNGIRPVVFVKAKQN